MMPHPERLYETALGGTDGRRVFESMSVVDARGRGLTQPAPIETHQNRTQKRREFITPSLPERLASVDLEAS